MAPSERGLIPPDQLIPAAERQLIIPWAWALKRRAAGARVDGRRAAADSDRRQRGGTEVSTAGFPEDIQRFLQETRLPFTLPRAGSRSA